MKITIQTISGINRVINVEPTTAIRQIKEQLYAIEGIQADQQRLLHHGAIINDTQTIESSNIADGEVLHMVLNIHGGC
jgi:hypothetical protein